jgi:ubiquinone biosynthesis protein
MGPAVALGSGAPASEDPRAPRRLSTPPGEPELPTPIPLASAPPVFDEWGPEQWEQAQWPKRRTLGMLTRWVFQLFYLRWLRGRPDLAARHVRGLFERLGGLWLEVGRLLARRHDLFSSVYTDELAKIAKPRLAAPFEVTRLLFEREFRLAIEDEFSWFDETPYAVLPFSQVYRARRKNGRQVVVKVQRPDVPAIFARDMGILRGVARVLDALRVWRHLRWKELIWEIEHTLTQESDLRYEAANLRRMRKNLRRHNVCVPRVHRELSSPRILTMDFFDAPTLSKVIRLSGENSLLCNHWLKVNGISRKKLGKRLLNTFLRQVLDDNLFHTNLSPDNVLVLKDSRLAFIGFGNVSSLEKYFLSIHGLSLRALSERDYVRMVDYLFLECDILPAVELQSLRVELGRLLRAFDSRAALHGVPYREKSYLALANDINQAMVRRRVVLSWQAVNIARAWVNLDDSLAFLLPNINIVKMLGDYFADADKRRWRSLYRQGIGALAGTLVSSITEQWMFFSAQLRKKAQVFQGVSSKAAYFASVLLKFGSRLGVLGVIASGWVFMNHHFPHWLGWLHHTDIGQQTRTIPVYPMEVGIVVLLVGTYVVYLMRRSGRRMAEDEARLP